MIDSYQEVGPPDLSGMESEVTATITIKHEDDKTTCPGDWDFGWAGGRTEAPICEDHKRVVGLFANQVDDKPWVAVIGQGHWGRAETLDEAYRIWRRQGGLKSRPHSVATFDAETAWVGFNPMRGVLFVGNSPEWREVG